MTLCECVSNNTTKKEDEEEEKNITTIIIISRRSILPPGKFTGMIVETIACMIDNCVSNSTSNHERTYQQLCKNILKLLFQHTVILWLLRVLSELQKYCHCIWASNVLPIGRMSDSADSADTSEIRRFTNW